MINYSKLDINQLKGRNRRLLYEWRKMDERLSSRPDIAYHVNRTNTYGLPVGYLIDYHLKSICSVEQIEHLGEPDISNPPIFASEYRLQISLPENYPGVDGVPEFRFLTTDDFGNPIPHPWHPNIRFFGEFAGRVCLNMPDTYTDLVWGVERIAFYLRYEVYHALSEPPFPEDLKVAAWVIRQGEPNEWIFFDQRQ